MPLTKKPLNRFETISFEINSRTLDYFVEEAGKRGWNVEYLLIAATAQWLEDHKVGVHEWPPSK